MYVSEMAELIKIGLTQKGFDGLYCTEENCGCSVDDLMPCGEIDALTSCEPGYETCVCMCGENHDFHIGPKKEES